MRKYLLSFVFLLLAGSAFTQSPSRVSGIVLHGGVPVENAAVAVFGENDIKVIQSVDSGPDGRFAFNLSPGRYRIAATKGNGRLAVGSPNQTIDVAPGQTVTIELALSLTASINESVTVSADQSQPIDEVSKTVNINTIPK